MAQIITISETANRLSKVQQFITTHGKSTIVLFLSKNTYTALDVNARTLHELIGTPTEKVGDVEITSFPAACDWVYFPKVVREGYKIAVIEDDHN